jgi:IPT/TIG domain-containing protein
MNIAGAIGRSVIVARHVRRPFSLTEVRCNSVGRSGFEGSMSLRRGAVGPLLVAASLVGCTDRDASPVAPAPPDTQSAPAVSSFSPAEGSIRGGAVVTFSGAGFRKGTTVTFGGRAALEVHVINGTVMHVIAPAHPDY